MCCDASRVPPPGADWQPTCFANAHRVTARSGLYVTAGGVGHINHTFKGGGWGLAGWFASNTAIEKPFGVALRSNLRLGDGGQK